MFEFIDAIRTKAQSLGQRQSGRYDLDHHQAALLGPCMALLDKVLLCKISHTIKYYIILHVISFLSYWVVNKLSKESECQPAPKFSNHVLAPPYPATMSVTSPDIFPAIKKEQKTNTLLLQHDS